MNGLEISGYSPGTGYSQGIGHDPGIGYSPYLVRNLVRIQSKHEHGDTHSVKGTYYGKHPRGKGVHPSGPLTVGDRPLRGNDRLHHQSIDNSEEEHAGIQRSQHIDQPRLVCQLVSAGTTQPGIKHLCTFLSG